MKILFISHHTKFRSGLRIINLARRLAARGYDITVLCIKETGRTGIHEYDEGSIHYVEFPDLLRGSLRSGWDLWDAINRWAYLRKNFDFDLVHAFETRPATIHPLQLALRQKKTPLVIDWIDWWGRGGLITTNRPKWYQVVFGGLETFYEEHFRTLADATTVICSELGRRAEGLGVPPDSIFHIPIGADIEGIPFVAPNTYRAEFQLDNSSQIAIFSALTGVMDIDLVFDAARLVHQTHPQFKLVMTGRGAEQCQQHALEKGLKDCFIHLGMLPLDQFAKALTCADVFLLPFADTPYNRGRWPCKMSDYLAAGRPIISNPVGDIRGLMQKHKVGILTDFNSNRFAEGIIKIIAHPDQAEQMQKTARHVAETDLNWDQIITHLEQAYRYAINRGNMPACRASLPETSTSLRE